MKTSSAVSKVRNKIIDALAWANPRPTTPIAFSLFLLQVLDESDFRIIDVFEKTAGGRALKWFTSLMEEAGVSQQQMTQ